jgi:hypothetical protein
MDACRDFPVVDAQRGICAHKEAIASRIVKS